MAPLEEKGFEDFNPFAARVEDEESSTSSETHSESSQVEKMLNAMSSLTCNKASSKDHAGFHNLCNPMVQKKLENIHPITSRGNSVPKSKLENGTIQEPVYASDINEELLARLSKQTSLLKDQATALTKVNDLSRKSSPAPSGSMSNGEGRSSSSPPHSANEIEQLRKELNAAKEKIAKQDKELHKTRVVSHVLDQPSPALELDAFKFKGMSIRQDLLDDAKSDISAPMSSFSRGVNVWDSVSQAGANPVQQQNIWSMASNKPWSNRGGSAFPQNIVPQPAARNYPTAASTQVSPDNSPFLATSVPFQLGNLGRSRTGVKGRGHAPGGWSTFWPGRSSPDVSAVTGINGLPYQHMGVFQSPQIFTPRSSVASSLSAMAPEFTLNNNQANYVAAISAGQSYVSPVEPLNYRKLLDRNVSCNWEYIVDKIVRNNDQQASIFLQQKLKVGTAEQKFEIVEAIVGQAYSLMVNRFGNFLVQRCFEHGTPQQVVAIANAIRGNTLTLSMDAFGCHVVQKAFDAVPEDYKAMMVHELLRRIPETVIHRYACHVWQKLFELRWNDSPPQIMKYVNDALTGMWPEVALGETGSLVVQNIFENCLEEDKRPCIDEVLDGIDIVSHGQFGNWCIQHICEHGAPADRARAIDHVLQYATEYSVDQFASKVVEKCLKIGGNEFLDRYLERVCEGRADRPRIPLIDIASDQYGNYLIQHVLTNASAQHREIVAAHIRKHMVSLRGSKFGSRVGLLCCNPAYATRPSPTVSAAGFRFPGSNNVGTISAPNSNTTVRYSSGTLH